VELSNFGKLGKRGVDSGREGGVGEGKVVGASMLSRAEGTHGSLADSDFYFLFCGTEECFKTKGSGKVEEKLERFVVNRALSVSCCLLTECVHTGGCRSLQ
jgi:hypothetical protein